MEPHHGYCSFLVGAPNDTHRAWHGAGSLGATRPGPASASAPLGANAHPARSAADHLADSGVGTGIVAMRTTSSMQPRLSAAIAPMEPAAVPGIGASAQTQSGPLFVGHAAGYGCCQVSTSAQGPRACMRYMRACVCVFV